MRKFLNGLVKVQYVNERYVVSGRELHKKCKVKKDFTDWIKDQLENTDATIDNDYTIWWTKENKANQLNDFNNLNNPFKVVVETDNIKQMVKKGFQQDYYLTLDIAKEICMVMGVAPRTNAETKALSKEIRKYFIECEKYIDETRQRELFNQWRREESKKTNEFFDLLGDDNKCKRFSIAIYNLVSYLRALDHRYKKEDLYRMYRKGTDIESWVLYLEVEDNLITFTKTFMAIGREDYMASAINLLHEYYIGDIDNYKEYIKTHKVYR